MSQPRRSTMFKSITSAISSIFRTIEKVSSTVEHSVDLADREVQLLEQRQEIRMAEIKQELDTKKAAFQLALETS